MFDQFLEIKGEAKRIKNKNVKYSLYLIAHTVTAFDSYVVLNNLPQWRTTTSSIKVGSKIVSLKIFKRCVDQAEKNPQYVQFRWGFLRMKDSLKKMNNLKTTTMIT